MTLIEKKTSATRNNKKKQKSFDEAILLPQNSSRNTADFQASSISFSGASNFSSFDLVEESEIVEKKAYPLPRPSGSPELSMKFDQRIAGFGSGTVLASSTSSSGSCSCSDEDDPVHDHEDFGSFSENGQICAMKEVRVNSDDETSKECLKQLNQEMALLSEQSHPNIVQYYRSKVGEDTLSMFLEYVSGGSIHTLLREYRPLNEPVIQSYTRQILSGDMKGANILVDPKGDIKVVDFGMAKDISSCSSMLSFEGRPYWMAPAVIQNMSGYSLAVYIWSLGCTIQEMATSKSPWSQYEGVAAIFKIANSKDLPEIPIYLSEDAQSFVKLHLQRDPSARPTAEQLLHHPFIQDQVTT